MRRLPTILCASMVVAAVAFPFGRANAQGLEFQGGQTVVGSANRRTTHYSPTMTFSPNFSNVYMYVQGDEDVADPYTADEIQLWIAPNTWAGLTSPFSKVSMILPNGTQYPAIYCYGNPNVLLYNQMYYLTAGQSDCANSFKTLLWGYSQDGQSFTWSTVLHYTGNDNGFFLTSGSFQRKDIGGVPYFYGILGILQNGGGSWVIVVCEFLRWILGVLTRSNF